MSAEEVRVCLALAVAETGLGRFCREYGLNKGNLYQVLSGIHGPQKEQLEILGLRKVVKYEI